MDIGDEMRESSSPHEKIEKDGGGNVHEDGNVNGNDNASSSSSSSGSSSSDSSSGGILSPFFFIKIYLWFFL